MNDHTPRGWESTMTIICLCGSTRFKDGFEHANRTFTRRGHIVLAPGVFGHSGDPLTDEEKVQLDVLHLAKIDMSDAVYVVNPGGYLGDSTRREIAYSQSIGKPVFYLVEPIDVDVEIGSESCHQDAGVREENGRAGVLPRLLRRRSSNES